MSVNSSTSSSDSDGKQLSARPGYYLLTFIAISLLSVIVLSALSFMTLSMGFARWHFTQLYTYQTAKIESLTDLDVLFVGDSSLGNAIDIAHWNETRTGKAEQLALTGVYGYAGSLNMLRRAVRTSRPKRVVIMHTLDMMNRPISDEGLMMTAYSIRDVLDAGLLVTFKYLANAKLLAHLLRGLVYGPPVMPSELYERDYWPQGPSLFERGKAPPQNGFNRNGINQAKLKYLRKIVEFCHEEGLSCIYAHGPVAEGICTGSTDYIGEVNRQIRSIGLPVLTSSPLCISWNEIGDSVDHVASAYRPVYSDKYGEFLDQQLKDL